jgi:hypothetical protein
LVDPGVDGEDNIKKVDGQEWTGLFWFGIGTGLAGVGESGNDHSVPIKWEGNF